MVTDLQESLLAFAVLPETVEMVYFTIILPVFDQRLSVDALQLDQSLD